MTQQDDWRPEMARLAQRQDQLEQQQRDSTRNVEALQRDVDRRMDSLRRETDRQFRDGDRRVRSLERSRDTTELLIWFCMPLVAAVAVIIVLVIAVVAAREQRQEPGEPEQRSPSSVDAPLAGSGGPWPPGFVSAGTPFRQHRREDHLLHFGAGLVFTPSKPQGIGIVIIQRGVPPGFEEEPGQDVPEIITVSRGRLHEPGNREHRQLPDALSETVCAGVAAASPPLSLMS